MTLFITQRNKPGSASGPFGKLPPATGVHNLYRESYLPRMSRSFIVAWYNKSFGSVARTGWHLDLISAIFDFQLEFV